MNLYILIFINLFFVFGISSEISEFNQSSFEVNISEKNQIKEENKSLSEINQTQKVEVENQEKIALAVVKELENLVIADRNYSTDSLTPDFDNGVIKQFIFEQRIRDDYKLRYFFNLNEKITVYSLDQWLTKRNTKNISEIDSYSDIQARIDQILEFKKPIPPPPPKPKVVIKPKVKPQPKPKVEKEKPKPKKKIEDWKLPKNLLPPEIPRVPADIDTPIFPDY